MKKILAVILLLLIASTAYSQTRVINLTGNWVDMSDNEAGFIIWKVNPDNTFTEIGRVGPNTVTFSPIVVTGVESSSHCFIVSAYNEAGDAKSPSACFTVPVQPPIAPVLTVSISATKQVVLNWQDRTDNEVSHRVMRNGVEIATLGPNVTTFTETVTGASGTAYNYSVSSVNSAGTALSNSVAVTVPATVPNAPSGFKLSALSSTQIAAAWKDNSIDEQGFRLRRTDMWRNNNAYADVRLAANTVSYVDTGLKRNASYCYCVEGYNVYGLSQGTDNCGCVRTLR